MQKTFKSYNFVTGAVDGTLAYDFDNPALYPDEELTYPERPRRRKQQSEDMDWVKENPERRTKAKKKAKERVQEQAAVQTQTQQRVPVMSIMGYAVVMVLCVMLVLAQIQLMDLSSTAAGLESQISELQTEKTKLTAEYETTFNLKDVEQYAINVLGMQEPQEDQVYYLTGVSAGDRAVVITQTETNIFSLGTEDLMNSIKAFVNGVLN